RRSPFLLRSPPPLRVSYHSPVQVMLGASLDENLGQFSRFQCGRTLKVDQAVDFRRIRARAADTRLVDKDFYGPADFRFQLRRADSLLDLHESLFPGGLYLVGHVIGQGVRGRPIDWRVLEAADAIQLGFFQEFQEFVEFGLGLAGEADDEGAA